MFAETENQSKLGELRKNKAESFTVKLVSIYQDGLHWPFII